MGSFFKVAEKFAGFAEKEIGKLLKPGSMVYHSTAAPVTRIEELLAMKSKSYTTAGPAVYVTTREAAEQYTKNVVGTKVLEGRLSPDIKLLSFNAPLPASVQEQLQKAGMRGKTYGEVMAEIREGGGEIGGKVHALQKSVAHEGYHGVTDIYPTREVIGIFGNEVLEGATYENLVQSQSVLKATRDLDNSVGVNKAVMKAGEGKSATSMAKHSLYGGNRTPRSL